MDLLIIRVTEYYRLSLLQHRYQYHRLHQMNLLIDSDDDDNDNDSDGDCFVSDIVLLQLDEYCKAMDNDNSDKFFMGGASELELSCSACKCSGRLCSLLCLLHIVDSVTSPKITSRELFDVFINLKYIT
ncbi:unnamed protein product [Didymodactylos carnosus]|uniref:Uncharacterized protein n=1 Tax=Didymodactylos carnosus TaxID=1234261 RepID=A0A8S2ZIR1_9BILA|nr:unnamed protein product [Didymodactylos carnosus]